MNSSSSLAVLGVLYSVLILFRARCSFVPIVHLSSCPIACSTNHVAAGGQ